MLISADVKLSVDKIPNTLLVYPAIIQHRWTTLYTEHIPVVCVTELLHISFLRIQRQFAFLVYKNVYVDHII